MIENRTFCKIVATIGPASQQEDKIEELVKTGVSVFRINMSHGSLEEYQLRVNNIRKMEKKYGVSLGILCDLQGPKLRVGEFKNYSVVLQNGQKFQLDLNPEKGDETRVCLPHPEIFKAMQVGMDLLVNDGLIRLKVESFTPDTAQTTVVVGGLLSDHKGVNVPGVKLPISALTEKDKNDLKTAERLGADFIGLSFVQDPEDIIELRSLMTSKAHIIAKIEKPAAIEHLRPIIDLADVLMVARGDLGVEVSTEMVPVLQKKIVSGCRKAGKPVIIATQMLESMINNPTPTRAEASDVATAVYDGVDAVMLSAETAAGKFPIESAQTMHRIIKTVENDHRYRDNLSKFERKLEETTEAAITVAAGVAAKNIQTANLIVNFTDSGATTLRTSKQRTGLHILSLTPNEVTAHQMAVVWGVTSIVVKDLNTFEDIPKEARKAALSQGLAKEGDKVVITAGIPFGKQGETNLLYVLSI